MPAACALNFDHVAVAQSLDEVRFRSTLDLLATYAGQRADLGPWLKGAAINHDRNLRLQYLAGMGLNIYQDGLIYESLSVYRKFPEDLFIGSEQRKEELRRALDRSSVGF